MAKRRKVTTGPGVEAPQDSHHVPYAPDPLMGRAARAALRNALDLAESAEFLHEKGKTGLANALFVLALEELEKGRHYRSMADDMSSTDPSRLGKEWVVSGRIEREHELKHLMSGAAGLVGPASMAFERKWAEMGSRLERMDMSWFPEGEPPADFLEAVNAMSDDPELETHSRLLRDLATRMEDIKEQGLYVDVVDGKVLSPGDASEKDYALLRDHFNDLVHGFSEGIAGAASPAKSAFHRYVMHGLIGHQTKPFFEGFPRGGFSRSARRPSRK